MKFKFLLNIVFIFVTQIFLGQDSLLNRIQHVFAVEFQYTPNQSRSKSDGKHSNGYFVSYNNPGIDLFYNLIIPNNTEAATLINGGVYYRNGNYENSGEGPGSSSVSWASYQVIRGQIGISEFSRLGKHRGFNFGGGLNFGTSIYSDGILYSQSSGYYPTQNGTVGVTYEYDISQILKGSYFSANLEINQSFKLAPKNYLIIGLKQYFETSDFYGVPINLSTGFYIGYKFK